MSRRRWRRGVLSPISVRRGLGALEPSCAVCAAATDGLPLDELVALHMDAGCDRIEARLGLIAALFGGTVDQVDDLDALPETRVLDECEMHELSDCGECAEADVILLERSLP